MTIIWLKSRKWKHADLDGKHVEFCITFPPIPTIQPTPVTAAGIGKFLMRGNGVEKLAADIVVAHPELWCDHLYHLPDSLFKKIVIHPDRSKAEFRVEGLFELGEEEVD